MYIYIYMYMVKTKVVVVCMLYVPPAWLCGRLSFHIMRDHPHRGHCVRWPPCHCPRAVSW